MLLSLELFVLLQLLLCYCYRSRFYFLVLVLFFRFLFLILLPLLCSDLCLCSPHLPFSLCAPVFFSSTRFSFPCLPSLTTFLSPSSLCVPVVRACVRAGGQTGTAPEAQRGAAGTAAGGLGPAQTAVASDGERGPAPRQCTYVTALCDDSALRRRSFQMHRRDGR